MIACSRAESLFSACWEDELSLAEKESLEAHIQACAACRAAYDGFTHALETLQGLPRFEAGPGFTEAVLARVHEAGKPALARTVLWRRRAAGVIGAWDWGFRPALAAAALTVVVGVGAYAVWNSGWISGSARLVRPVSTADVRGGVPTPSPRSPVPAVARVPASAEAPATVRPTPEKGAARATQASRLERVALAGRAGADSVVPDSLFDHAYDLEFAFDPVNLRRVPGEQSLRPARPMPASDVGRKASITF